MAEFHVTYIPGITRIVVTAKGTLMSLFILTKQVSLFSQEVSFMHKIARWGYVHTCTPNFHLCSLRTRTCAQTAFF